MVIFALLAVSLGTASPAAAEFRLKPYLQGGARFDTNPRYLSNDQNIESAWGSIFDVRLPFEYLSPRSSISLEPRLVYSFYPDDEDEDLEDEDKYLTGRANWQLRRSSIGAGYGYTDLSLRTSEFDNAGGTAPGGTGTSRIFFKDSQQRWYVQPYWQFQFSPANSFTLNGNYEEVRYDEKRASRRFDYDFNSITAAFNHALNERHTLGLQAGFTKFDSENEEIRITNNSETNSLSLIYEYAWSETTSLSADIGWARTKNEVMRPNFVDPVDGPVCEPALIPIFPCEFKSDSSNFIGNLTATKRTKTVEYKLVVGQSITPNSNGAEVLRFSIDGLARKQFTERFRGSLGVIAFTQSDIGSAASDFGRDYIRVNARADYGFTRHWSFYGAYRYTFSDETRILTSDRVIRDHYFSMGVTFRGDGWRW